VYNLNDMCMVREVGDMLAGNFPCGEERSSEGIIEMGMEIISLVPRKLLLKYILYLYVKIFMLYLFIFSHMCTFFFICDVMS